MTAFLYVSPGILTQYSGVKHVDSIRFTELHKGLQLAGANLTPFDLFKFRSQPTKAMQMLDAADTLFVHHESSLRTLCALLPKEDVLDLLRRKRSLLQADCFNWKWLKLDPEEFLPFFDTVATANVKDAEARGFPHIPLGMYAREHVYDPASEIILYMGRYQTWFNERMSRVVDAAANARFEILTYAEHRESVDTSLTTRANVTVTDAVEYLSIQNVVPAAKFGLAFFNSWHPNGKIWDYLSLGLPVLFEGKVSEAGMLREFNAGIEIEPADLTGLTEKLARYERPSFSDLLTQHSWRARAKAWVSLAF